MADFFFDTSALVKRFSPETGTAWVIDLIRPASGHTIYLANITSVEVVSAITRRMRGGHLTMAAAKKALTRFHRSFLRRYVIAEINPPLISRATTLAETYALRGYDAVQLAAAAAGRSGRHRGGDRCPRGVPAGAVRLPARPRLPGGDGPRAVDPVRHPASP